MTSLPQQANGENSPIIKQLSFGCERRGHYLDVHVAQHKRFYIRNEYL